MLERGDESPAPDRRRRTAELARMAAAPSGLVAAGGGVLITELAHLPVVVVVVVGVGAWAVRLAGALVRRGWRRMPVVRIDPVAVPEPWRGLVREALGSQQEFDRIVGDWPAGPTRDRLAAARPTVAGATDEVWRIARMGASLAPATADGTAAALSARLRAVQAGAGQGTGTRGPGTVRTGPGTGAPAAGAAGAGPAAVDEEPAVDEEAALAAQLSAARRREATAQEAVDRLRVIVAELTTAVTDLGRLALGGGDADPPVSALHELPGELGSLRQALAEAREGA